MVDGIAARYGDLLTGSYDCVDRIALNAYFSMGHNPGGFRVWWRRLHGDSDTDLDNAHLMRMAGRFARRVRGWAKANDIPVIDCKAGERKHEIAEQYLAEHSETGRGVFMVLVARAPASTWDVQRSKTTIKNLAKRRTYINHYSFHILDPDWGHMTIKMAGHPPFGAQVILNGHEHVAAQARRLGVSFEKEGNCFTQVTDPDGLARIADTLSHPATAGRLGRVIDRWIYTCVSFGLDLADKQASGFGYSYSIYQIEYSRNLLFASGQRMERLFDSIVDRTRSRLDIARLRTMFGVKQRPRTPGGLSPLVAAVIETPSYDLTIFKVHFGALTLKGYTKGERVLRFEAVCHNTRALNTGRLLDRFGDIVERLHRMLDEFCTVLDCVDTTFIPTASSTSSTNHRRLAAPESAASTSTNHEHIPPCAPSSRCAPNLTGSVSPTSPPRSTRSPGPPTTRSARPPTTCANSAGTPSSTNPAADADTTCHPNPPASSPHCSPCASTSSRRSSPASADPPEAARPPPAPSSTATTRTSAPT
ncbi:MAG: hypothetical protein ACSLFI_07910 [Solirubrobacterales bacterium]